MNQRTGWLLALASVLIFSTNTPIARSVIGDGSMNPITLVMLRFVLAAMLFGITMSVTSLGAAKGDEQSLDRRIIWICLASGGINGITLAAFYSALQTLEASLTSVLGIAMFPSMTLLILALGGESLTAKKMTRLGIALLGLYALLGMSGQLNMRGVLFVVVAATTYAIHLATVQWYMKPYNTWATTSLMMAGSAVVVLILWLASGADLMVPGWRGWLIVAYQVVVLTFIGRTLTYAAIARIGSGQMALLTPVETVLTIVWSILFLSESLTSTQWIGATLILLSAVLAADFRRTWRGQVA